MKFLHHLSDGGGGSSKFLNVHNNKRSWYFFLVVILCLSTSCLLIEYNFLKVSLAAGKSEYFRQHNMNSTDERNNIRVTVTGEVAKEVENYNISSSSSSLSHSTFWESIDLNRKLDCGRYKCLFRDKTNVDVGYLIFNNHPSIGHQFQTEAIMSYRIAQYMTDTFDTKHLLLGPPTVVKMIHFTNDSSSQISNINSTVKGSEQQHMYMYYANQYAIVQKVKIAPHPWIIVMPQKDSISKIKYFYRKKTNISRSSFTGTLRNDTMSAIQTLQNIPLLSHDYQIIIDGCGNLYQFDIDRIFLGGVYKESSNKFDKTFIKNYDKSMFMLNNILKWTSSSSHHHHHHGSNNGVDHDSTTTAEASISAYQRNGEEILSDYYSNETATASSSSSSSYCHAMNIVKNMSGRILISEQQQHQQKKKKEVTRIAMLMMIYTVEMVIRKEEYSVSSNETTNNILNCG